MTLKKRLQLGLSALLCTASLVSQATAAPAALSPADVRAYSAAFAAADRGDFIDSQLASLETKDKSLLGYLSFSELMHPTAHKAAFGELAGWLTKFRDLPVADRIFALAARRSPSEARNLPTPTSMAAVESRNTTDRGRKAREAFYSGEVQKALTLAQGAGERWITGLAAYRLRSYGQAQLAFEALARDPAEDPWLRAAGGFWAARAAHAAGNSASATANLALAAQAPHTFYGMIAQRTLQLQAPAIAQTAVQASGGQFVLASYNAAAVADVAQFIASDIRAHRATALAQIGRSGDAAHELRAGLSQARTPDEQQSWTDLAASLSSLLARPSLSARALAADDHPTPLLEPRSGFTIDKALVYAIVRQESRFNPMAVSPAGAVGLMQLMPEAAARAAGDDKLKADMSPLFDAAFNLRVGQDYLTWLMERGVGYDLLRVIAAYNGGPGTLQRTANMLGDDTDSLMLIESLPAAETRNYVEKVLAGYWTYRRMWGQDTASLDALATGARSIDPRLDLADPRGAGTQFSAQGLQVRTP